MSHYLSDEVIPPSICKIPGWHGFAVKFSPFNADLVVCAGNQNYGELFSMDF